MSAETAVTLISKDATQLRRKRARERTKFPSLDPIDQKRLKGQTITRSPVALHRTITPPITETSQPLDVPVGLR